MQGNGCFDNAEVGTDMSADFAVAVQHGASDFFRQRFKLFQAEFFYVCG